MVDELYSLDEQALRGRLLDAVSEGDRARLEQAIDFARERHAGQQRDGGTDFILHPLRTAILLIEVGGIQLIDVVISGLLHDLLEDTETTAEEIQEAFGFQVGRLVKAQTLPPLDDGETKHERANRYFKKLAWADRDAKVIKSADRLDNLHTIADSEMTDDRRAEYLVESRNGLLPLTLSCNTGLYHAMDAVLKGLGSHPS